MYWYCPVQIRDGLDKVEMMCGLFLLSPLAYTFVSVSFQILVRPFLLLKRGYVALGEYPNTLHRACFKAQSMCSLSSSVPSQPSPLTRGCLDGKGLP